MGTWINEDGLKIRFDTDRSEVRKEGTNLIAPVRAHKVVIDSTDLPAAADAGADQDFIPAGALIIDSYLVATSAWTGVGTLTIGLANAAGTAIDADGIDAAIDVDVALAAAGDVVANDGELVDKTATIGSADGYVYAVATGAVSGTAELVILYIEV